MPDAKPQPEEGLPVAPIGSDDDAADRWKTDPFLHSLVTTQQQRYQRLCKELVGAALQSSDPAVRARGAQITEIEINVLVLTGKRKFSK